MFRQKQGSILKQKKQLFQIRDAMALNLRFGLSETTEIGFDGGLGFDNTFGGARPDMSFSIRNVFYDRGDDAVKLAFQTNVGRVSTVLKINPFTGGSSETESLRIRFMGSLPLNKTFGLSSNVGVGLFGRDVRFDARSFFTVNLGASFGKKQGVI